MSPIDPRDVQALGWTLLHFVWQGTALAALLAALDLLLRQAPAPVRYRLASATLGLMLLLPLATFGIVRGSEGRGRQGEVASATRPATVAPPAVMSTAAAAANGGAAAPANAMSDGVRGRVEALLPAFVGLWCAGVLFLSLRTLGGFALVQRLKRSGLRPPSPALVETVARLKQALDVSAAVRVCESARVQVPTVVGWLRPVVLVPMSAVENRSRSSE